jgi:hypothetical protein
MGNRLPRRSCERAVIRASTGAAMQHKRANGQRVGTIPYGFDLDHDDRQDPEPQASRHELSNFLEGQPEVWRSAGLTRLEPMGFEPTTFWLQIASLDPPIILKSPCFLVYTAPRAVLQALSKNRGF